MKRFKKAIICASIMLCAVGSVSAPVQAKQVGTVCGHPIFDNHFGEVEITNGGSKADITNRKANYVAKYDPRELGLVTAVEDQGQTNTCWAFATNAAIEANLLKKGYENSSLNLSENHLAYFFYNRQTDPLGYTQGDQNLIPTPKTWSMNGGTLYGTSLALSTWAGVVKDTVPSSEDDATGAYVPFDIVDKSTCYKSDYVVKNVYMYEYKENTVKQAITDYGAVACGICSSGYGYFSSSDGKAYYYPYEDLDEDGYRDSDHAVAIVGWDDNYSRENFDGAAKPRNNGAWIVKNSWGSDVHDGGYLYVSYEDKSLCEIVAYDMMSVSERNDNNYQHDGNANCASALGTRGTSITAANVFKAKGSSAGYNELLEAVSVCTYSTNVDYSLQIYTGVTSSTNPTKGKAMFSNPKSGMFTNAGYNRIELDTPVMLTSGEKYAVVVTLSAPNGVAIGTEEYARNDAYVFLADVEAGEGFLKNGDGWLDCSDFYLSDGSHIKCNLRIKAFTSNTQQKTSYKLSNKSMGISKGSSTKVALKINPSSVKRKVTWSSSNKKVAKVSSSGKVTGKGYGKATIKAKFVAGSKTKTLMCTVTVGPSKIKNFKVQGAKKKITVNWKKNDAASGYEISYSKKKDGGYKTLTTVKSGSTTKCSKSLKKGTYYVKMRPYMTKDGKKLYGSYTSVKKVKVK